MSPEEREARLIEEVRVELERLDRVVRELGEAATPLQPACPAYVRMAVAGYLHSFYTGCEAILARISRAAGDMPKGDGWHQELLFRSTAPLAGARPPVISPETATALQVFLRFRHFFRVSYGVELDGAKLRENATLVGDAHIRFRDDVNAFLRRLG